MIHHEHISEYHPDDHTDREKDSCSHESSKMENEECWKKEKNEIEKSFSEMFLPREKSIRFDDEVKVDEHGSYPKKHPLIFMKEWMSPRSTRKYLVVVPYIGIVDIGVRRVMMSDIVLFEPPR